MEYKICNVKISDVGPICLPDAKENYDNVIALGTGWGRLKYYGPNNPSSDILRKVELQTMNNAACRRWMGSSSITDNMICAGDGKNDTCKGDSGGALATEEKNGRYTQIGIVSWGRGCGTGTPGVYTRLTSVLTWIKLLLLGKRVGLIPAIKLEIVGEKTIEHGTIHDSFDEAEASVNKMKAESGFGVSTRIVLHNETPDSLTFTGSDDYAGHFGIKPPLEVKSDIFVIELCLQFTSKPLPRFLLENMLHSSTERKLVACGDPGELLSLQINREKSL